MSLKVFKLSTGEEVIGETRESMTGEFFISRPRTFQVMQDPSTGQIRAALAPFLMSNPDAEVKIELIHIITYIDAPVELERSYLQQTSGLDLTTKF